MLLKRNSQSTFGRLLVSSTPFIGMIFASSVNLSFSRSKEVMNGIPINNPATNQQDPSLVSKKAARQAFLDSWLIRILMPIPLTLIPRLSSNWAARNMKFYQKAFPKLMFDVTVVGFSLWGALLVILSGFSNVGTRKLQDLEPHIQEALKDFPPTTEITFSKGL